MGRAADRGHGGSTPWITLRNAPPAPEKSPTPTCAPNPLGVGMEQMWGQAAVIPPRPSATKHTFRCVGVSTGRV